jgi:hypothetical protein
VPIVAWVVWADDGEEYIDTWAAGWSGQLVYVRLPDRRYRLTSVWLRAEDVRRVHRLVDNESHRPTLLAGRAGRPS